MVTFVRYDGEKSRDVIAVVLSKVVDSASLLQAE
jgi:hypothetical protein